VETGVIIGCRAGLQSATVSKKKKEGILFHPLSLSLFLTNFYLSSRSLRVSASLALINFISALQNAQLNFPDLSAILI